MDGMNEFKTNFKVGIRVKLMRGDQPLSQSGDSLGTITVPETSRIPRCIVKWDTGAEYAYKVKQLLILPGDWDE